MMDPENMKFKFLEDKDDIWTEMFNNEYMSDVQFKGYEENDILYAHSFLLALRSEVFNRQFYGSLKKLRVDGSDKIQITITDLGWEAFKLLIRFLYKDDKFLSDSGIIEPTVMVDLLYGAKKYMLIELKTEILKRITNDNSNAHIYYMASFVHEEIDQTMHLQIAALNYGITLKDNLFLIATYKVFTTFIKYLIDHKCVPSAIIFETILKWVKYNVPEASKEGGAVNNAKEIFEIMENYDFEPDKYLKGFNRIELEEIIIKKKLYKDEAHLLSLLLNTLTIPKIFPTTHAVNDYSPNFIYSNPRELLFDHTKMAVSTIYPPYSSQLYIVGISALNVNTIYNLTIEVFLQRNDDIPPVNMLNFQLDFNFSCDINFPDIPLYPGYVCKITINKSTYLTFEWKNELIEVKRDGDFQIKKILYL